jgi:hypothetical protein
MPARTSQAGHRRFLQPPRSSSGGGRLPPHGAPWGPGAMHPWPPGTPPPSGSMHRWFPAVVPESPISVSKRQSNCRNFGGRRWVRTTGFSLVSKVRNVSGGCWEWPDGPSSCGDPGWEWPGVARSLWALALGLALGISPPDDCRVGPRPRRRVVASHMQTHVGGGARSESVRMQDFRHGRERSRPGDVHRG